jgi:hypothetical protein
MGKETFESQMFILDQVNSRGQSWPTSQNEKNTWKNWNKNLNWWFEGSRAWWNQEWDQIQFLSPSIKWDKKLAKVTIQNLKTAIGFQKVSTKLPQGPMKKT